jgi:hypothetical protein
LTEFWSRMDEALTPAYSHSWAHDFVLSELGSRTAEQALADGEDAVTVWRAVHATLELPTRDR